MLSEPQEVEKPNLSLLPRGDRTQPSDTQCTERANDNKQYKNQTFHNTSKVPIKRRAHWMCRSLLNRRHASRK